MAVHPLSARPAFGLVTDVLNDLGVFLVVVVLGVLAVVFQYAFTRATFSSGGSPSPASLTNCPACGARTPLADDACDHCGEPLPAPGRPDGDRRDG